MMGPELARATSAYATAVPPEAANDWLRPINEDLDAPKTCNASAG
jgi:hypothetical protein